VKLGLVRLRSDTDAKWLCRKVNDLECVLHYAGLCRFVFQTALYCRHWPRGSSRGSVPEAPPPRKRVASCRSLSAQPHQWACGVASPSLHQADQTDRRRTRSSCCQLDGRPGANAHPKDQRPLVDGRSEPLSNSVTLTVSKALIGTPRSNATAAASISLCCIPSSRQFVSLATGWAAPSPYAKRSA